MLLSSPLTLLLPPSHFTHTCPTKQPAVPGTCSALSFDTCLSQSETSSLCSGVWAIPSGASVWAPILPLQELFPQDLTCRLLCPWCLSLCTSRACHTSGTQLYTATAHSSLTVALRTHTEGQGLWCPHWPQHRNLHSPKVNEFIKEIMATISDSTRMYCFLCVSDCP